MGSAVLTLLVAGVTAWTLISFLEVRLRPVLRDAAQYQIQNRVVSKLEHSITREMADRQSYLSVQRDDSGRIQSVTTDAAGLNLLRAELVSGILKYLEELDTVEVDAPLGTLLESELIWGRGPTMKVRAVVLGTVSAEFKSELSSAGINQTMHRLWLEILVPVRLFLPGGPADVSVETSLVVAETVIVGEIPLILSGQNTGF